MTRVSCILFKICGKGRAKCPDKHMTCKLEQMLIRTFDERMRPRKRSF